MIFAQKLNPENMIKLALVGFLGAMASIAVADDANPAPDKIEEIHEDWSEWVLGTANKIDGFFSNSQADEDAQKTRVRGWIQGQYDENEGSKVRLRVRARLSLPKTENRISLVIGDDENEQSQGPDDQNQQNVSLQFRSKRDTALKTVRFDLGIRRRDSKYQLYGRARHTKIFETASAWVPRLTNSFYYFTKSRFEYRGEAQFDRVLGKNLFFRPISVLRWYENNPDECNGGWCYDQFFSLYQRLDQKKPAALAYDLEFYFREKPEFDVFDTVIKARYRRKTDRDWLFWEVEPGIHFPSDYDHDLTFRILVKLEGVFGYNTEANINDYFTPAEADWASQNPTN